MNQTTSFPGDAPEGNKIEKSRKWLCRANTDSEDPLKIFGALIAEFMDAEPTPGVKDRTSGEDLRDRVAAALAREGLSYSRGGYIHGAALSGPSRSLADRIKSDGIQAIEIEYDRCQSASDRDPGSASKRDPTFLRFERLALAPSELVGVAETGRARVVG